MNWTKKKVLIVLGTRPEVIKMFPVIKVLKNSNLIDFQILSTKQQNLLLESALNEFQIQPDLELKEYESSSLVDSLSEIMRGIESKLQDFKPDFLLVQGDTTTAFAGALVGYLNGVAVAHLEAGLRTMNLKRPFPEEGFRQSIARLTTIHLAPTEQAVRNLKREGIDTKKIFLVGNSIVDSLKFQMEDLQAIKESQVSNKLLVTLHRRENFGKNIEQVCLGIKKFVFEYSGEIQATIILHSNPNSFLPIKMLLGNQDRIQLIQPPKRRHFLQLLVQCGCVLTDSGGVQEEAHLLDKKLLIVRSETERPEVFNGDAKFVDLNEESVYLSLVKAFSEIKLAKSPYNGVNLTTALGDGETAIKVRRILENYEKDSLD